MNEPKISVLIPLYNRKHYIANCIDSVLVQTFQDFEIIVRDDGSTDGSAEFVEERYAAEISTGKLKLKRNPKNVGEATTDNRLIYDATGKYIMILHSDDMFVSNALEHMYAVAEEHNADVVHSSMMFRTRSDGSFDKPDSLIFGKCDKRPVKDITIMSNDPAVRFKEWLNGKLHIDAQYNIFNRKFLIDNDILFWEHGEVLLPINRFFALKWILHAKIFVKTCEPFYIRRNSPDAISKTKVPPERVARFIAVQIKFLRHLDEYFASEDFFRNDEKRQYQARSCFLTRVDHLRIKKRNVYKRGVTSALNHAVEEIFKKYFGDNYAYPAFLFHRCHCLIEQKPIMKFTVSPEIIQES